MSGHSFPRVLAALAIAVFAVGGAAEAKGFKFRFSSSSPSTPKVVTPPPPAVQRTTPPSSVPTPAVARPAPPPGAQPAAFAPGARPLTPPAPALTPPRDSFMSGLTGGLVGYVVGKSIARSFNSPEAWGGLVLQLLIFAGLGFLAFKVAMTLGGGGGQPAYAGVPAGRGGVDPDRLTRVVDRKR